MSLILSKSFLRTALLALAIPAIGLPATVNLTGPQVSLGGSTGPTSFNQSVTFGNGDAYSVTGTYGASYNGGTPSIFINPVVTYVGLTPSVGNDTISLSYTQTYFDNSRGSWNGTYAAALSANFSGTQGPGSTISGTLSYDGQPINLGMTNTDGILTASDDLTGLTGNTLTAVYTLIYAFNAGSQPNAILSSPEINSAPEPAEALPLGLGLAGILGTVIYRRRVEKKFTL